VAPSLGGTMSDQYYKSICKLSNINRFQGMRLQAPYSVAEHTFRMTMIAMRLADDFPSEGVDIELILKSCLLHDIEEALMGDIPTPYKKYIPGYKKGSEEALQKEGVLPFDYREIWKNAKSDTIEGFIVEMADKLELFMTACYELSSGNSRLQSTYDDSSKWFDKHKEIITMWYPYAEELLLKGHNDVNKTNI